MHQLHNENVTLMSPKELQYFWIILKNIMLLNVSLKCIFIITNQIPVIVKRNYDAIQPNIAHIFAFKIPI